MTEPLSEERLVELETLAHEFRNRADDCGRICRELLDLIAGYRRGVRRRLPKAAWKAWEATTYQDRFSGPQAAFYAGYEAALSTERAKVARLVEGLRPFAAIGEWLGPQRYPSLTTRWAKVYCTVEGNNPIPECPQEDTFRSAADLLKEIEG